MSNGRIVLSAFLDEAVPREEEKTLEHQLIAGAAVGLKYWTPRFISVGTETQNVSMLKPSERQVLDNLVAESQRYGFNIWCLGTPIGKSKLADVDDGNKAPYKTQYQILDDTKNVLEIAQKTGAKAIRGFSFYYPIGKNRADYHSQSVDLLGRIVDDCKNAGIVYLLEPETGLVANDATQMIRIAKDINSPYLLLLPDAANFHIQGLDAASHFKSIVDSGFLGAVHIKDYTRPCLQSVPPSAEETLKDFGSVEVGLTKQYEMFGYLKPYIKQLNNKLQAFGLPGLVADIEGHMKGGGQFGGFSGPDGLGVATRAFTKMLDNLEIPYVIRSDNDIVKK